MGNEEKMLGILAQIQETQKQMQEEQKQMREDIQQIKDRLARVEDRSTRTALLQENEILRTINALGEGQELTQQMMRELTSKREADELRDQVEILRAVVA